LGRCPVPDRTRVPAGRAGPPQPGAAAGELAAVRPARPAAPGHARWKSCSSCSSAPGSTRTERCTPTGCSPDSKTTLPYMNCRNGRLPERNRRPAPPRTAPAARHTVPPATARSLPSGRLRWRRRAAPTSCFGAHDLHGRDARPPRRAEPGRPCTSFSRVTSGGTATRAAEQVEGHESSAFTTGEPIGGPRTATTGGTRRGSGSRCRCPGRASPEPQA